MKITCSACGELTGLGRSMCDNCGALIPKDFYQKAKKADDAFLELPGILSQMERFNGSAIADIVSAERVCTKAQEIKNAIGEFRGEDRQKYDTLEKEADKLSKNIQQAKQRAEEDRRRAEEDRQRSIALALEADKKAAKNRALAELWRIYIGSVIFSVVYFAVAAAIIWGIVTFLSGVDGEMLKNVITLGFTGIGGLTLLIVGASIFVKFESGCLGRILGAIGGGLGGMVIPLAFSGWDYTPAGTIGLIIGLILGAGLGWLSVGIILGGGIGAIGGYLLGWSIMWSLMSSMGNIIVAAALLIPFFIFYVKILSRKFLISDALLERCGKAGKARHATRNLLITASMLLLAAVFGIVYYPQVSKVVEQVRGSVMEIARKKAEERAMTAAGFVRIQGGVFTMGSPDLEVSRSDEEVWHQVTVSPFYMGKHEVTQQEYLAVMENNPSKFKGDNLPVERVSWLDAVTYCNKRSQNEGLIPAYTIDGENVTWDRGANGYRLPTEAEWEYACRAGATGPFGIGDITTAQANYDGNYAYDGRAQGEFREKTWDVGSGAANEWGLYDMHGNVREWCWDWYGAYSADPQTDPAGPDSGLQKVFRGGSWYNSAQYLRSACRNSGVPASRDDKIGFRLVRS
jgi:formylglycine-generating enzyme required for sulfatase activity